MVRLDCSISNGLCRLSLPQFGGDGSFWGCLNSYLASCLFKSDIKKTYGKDRNHIMGVIAFFSVKIRLYSILEEIS